MSLSIYIVFAYINPCDRETNVSPQRQKIWCIYHRERNHKSLETWRSRAHSYKTAWIRHKQRTSENKQARKTEKTIHVTYAARNSLIWELDMRERCIRNNKDYVKACWNYHKVLR